jgi:putative membrane protein insertion efficiency factor
MPARALAGNRPGLVARAVLACIRGYQVALSPMYAGSCRYVPSCSQYASEAVQKFGAARGSWLAVRRLMRCHPFGSSGIDPVPD